MLIHPLQAEEFKNIVSEKTGTNMVNVDKVLQEGKRQLMLFKYLPKDLLPVLQKTVVIMKRNKNTEQCIIPKMF